MKKSNLILTALLISTTLGCISIYRMPTRLDDDGTSALTKADSTRIHEFGTYFNHHPLDSVNYQFETIGINGIKTLSKNSKYSWFMIYAPWCSHSDGVLARNERRFQQDLYTSYNLKLYGISQSYDLKNVQKILTTDKKIFIENYILDSREFGTDEGMKTINMATTLWGDTLEWPRGVPRSIIVDSNLHLVAYLRGSRINLDTVLKYIKAYELKEDSTLK